MEETSWESQVKRGLIELCILNILRQESTHGYQIVKYLNKIGGLLVSEGTVYPILSRLKKENLLKSVLQESDQGPAKKIYSLTSTGKEKLTRINDLWVNISASVNMIINNRREEK